VTTGVLLFGIWVERRDIGLLDIGILAKIGRDYPIGKKLDNLCYKLLHLPIRQYANTPTTFSTFQLLPYNGYWEIKILGY
jgi:hypothetical protein